MRLDKFISEAAGSTRSQARDCIRKGWVSVNGVVRKQPQMQITEEVDQVALKGQVCSFRRQVFYMLNKPAGVVSATRDNTADTVLQLLKGISAKDLFPVGRLDKDTEGLLLITNDGALAHRLLSPKYHVEKTYLVRVRVPLSQDDVRRLELGIDIGDEKPTLPAAAVNLEYPDAPSPEGHFILLTIREGRFHQVKRMLFALGNEVLYLKRVSFGPLKLDTALQPGMFRELTEEEIGLLAALHKERID